ncbi:MAG: hypothetical protein RL760_784 [Candidatus Eisenbacteria bacterium]
MSAVALTPLVRRSLPTALAALLLVGCHGRAPESAPERAERTVTVVTLASGPAGTLTVPARIKAAEEATLVARIAGRVSGFPVREGTQVTAGTMLVRFDAPEARHALSAARADEQAARSAATAASRQHARVEALAASGVMTTADREAAEAADRTAAARLEQATAARETAEAAFEVRAPFAGVLVRRHVDAGADVMPGTPLVDLRSPSGNEVVSAVPEAAAAELGRARTWLQVGDGAWQSARLLRADGMVDPATRTRTAHFAVPAGLRAEPGTFARIRIESREADTAGDASAPLAVPMSSVVRRGALTGVFMVEDARVWLRWVRLGRSEGAQVEVIAGLDAGMQVVADPNDLEDGMRVKVVTAATTAGGAR